jgi:hypothetical protein
VFITEATHRQIAQLAEVAEPILLDAKGLSEPLKLYELRSLRGRFAQSDAPDAATLGREVVVSLSMTCKVIDGKAVRAETIDGEVIRIAGHQLIARLTTGLDPLTNVRLRLRYSASGPESDDIYGKVVRADGEGGERLARIHMTSTSDADAERLEALLR